MWVHSMGIAEKLTSRRRTHTPNPTRRRLLKGMLVAPLALGWQPLAWAALLPTSPLTIHSRQGPHRLTVEVANSSSERSQGLMERESLARDAGMLFLYDVAQPARSGFWMYRTRIPLDIAFLDAEGRINEIHRMQPCRAASPSDCPVTRAEAPYHAALEVNAGYFEARDIQPGDCVSWPAQDGGACR
ncbi:DUF192 domain-containing protein [Halomonas halmophila]|uniref:DUF192 domain-containing protein n=1 Tax=Halomonas halmophila TaxID=252 RepID=A0A4Y4F3G9_9GAMM|nr:DUF192 domain-containing protein [Halomonas halmophila]GED22394.1 hypothetical protein HHA01_13710 [Halomonas halmophila]